MRGRYLGFNERIEILLDKKGAIAEVLLRLATTHCDDLVQIRVVCNHSHSLK